jgi:prolyl-tRNA editing enzyme YbaK/EbsC (Cys-tRNA(Pro) deacylase)
MRTVYGATDAVRTALSRAGYEPEIAMLDESVHTAALAAERLGVPVGAIANSLVFDAGGEPVLVMTSGAHRVDTGWLGGQLGTGPLRRADPDFVRRHTGQPIGGVAPVGHPGPLRTVVDTDLAAFPQLWAAAGHPRTVFPIDYPTLVRITGGTELSVVGT